MEWLWQQRREVKDRKSRIERKRRDGGLKVETEKGRLVRNIRAETVNE